MRGIVTTTNPTAKVPAGDLPATVRARYGAIASRVSAGQDASCCNPSCCGGALADPVSSNLYNQVEAAAVPKDALTASLGCGNPTALATLEEGQTVLDLGSGGGIDVLLSAQRVGPTGKVYGLDMTDEMLALARENQRQSGLTNVEFLKGEIEAIPLPSNSVDVVLSNCVINLSGDKQRVLAEAFRVLKPGGRFAISDVVVRGVVPDAVRRNMELWVGCIAGALDEDEFYRLLADTGFEEASIEPTRIYEYADARALLTDTGLEVDAVAEDVAGRIMGAFVRARKPAQ